MLGQEPAGTLPGETPIVARDTAARTGAPLILAALLFGGCASVSDVTGVATQQDLMEVRTELAVVQKSALMAKADAEAALAQIDKRQRERTAEDERRLQVLAQRLEGLSTGLTSLAGRLDDLNTRTEALGRQMRGATAVPPRGTGTGARPRRGDTRLAAVHERTPAAGHLPGGVHRLQQGELSARRGRLP